MTPLKLRPAVAIGAVAVAAASIGAGTASAGTPGQHHTRLAIHVGRHAIKAGHTDHVFGRLRVVRSESPAGRTITLEARPNGQTGFTSLGTATTAAHGRVKFAVTPATTTHYKLVFAGDPIDRASHSWPAVIRIRKPHTTPPTQEPSSLSIRALPATRGEVISGQLRGMGHGALPGRKISLQEQVSGASTWTDVATKHTSAHGHVAFTEAPVAVLTSYRLVFAGGPRFTASQSGVVGS